MIQGRKVNQVAPHLRDVAFVPQQGGYYDDLEVHSNLTSAVDRKRFSPKQLQQKLDLVVQMLELESYLQHRPYQLSGGLLQRMALGRGLMRSCHLLLLDEPLNHLDTNLRTKLRRSMIGWQRETKQTMIYVTHDPVEAMAIGHNIAIMQDGKLLQCGVPEKVFNEPEHQIVASLLDANMRFYPAQLQVHEGQGTIQLFRHMIPCRLSSSSNFANLNGETKVTVGLRADDVRFAERRDPALPLPHGEIQVAVRPRASCFHGSYTQWTCWTDQGDEVIVNVANAKNIQANASHGPEPAAAAESAVSAPKLESAFIAFRLGDLQIFDELTGNRIHLT
jgi:ABC-type sugar transport system ATPase subunit